MKKIVILLLLLSLLCGTALASPSVTLEEVFTAPGERLKLINTDAEEPFIAARKDRKEGVYNAQGELIIPFTYGAISHLGHGLFEAINEEGLNNHGLINSSNELVIDYAYAAYELISPQLVAAMVLQPATGEVYDYASGFLGSGDKYIIERCDIYNVITKEKLGSLPRDDYEKAKAIDGHLAVQNRLDKVTIYDMQLQPVATADSLYQLGYALQEKDGATQVVGRYSGNVIAENVRYRYLNDAGDDRYIKVRQSSGEGIIDLEGKLLVPVEYDTIYTSSTPSGYVVCIINGKKGVADLQGNLLVPCSYDDIPQRFSRIFHNGYALVEKDGKYGFVNQQGEVTLPIEYSKSAKVHGCSLSIPDIDGSLYLLSADGVKAKTDYESFDEYFSNGLILRAKKAGVYDIIDWHGNVLIPGTTTSAQATQPGSYLLLNDTLYRVGGK